MRFPDQLLQTPTSVYSSDESNITQTKKTFGGNMSEQHSAKINCPRSHCPSLYHIFISLNDEGVMGKSRPKLLSSYNVSSSALPIPPMLSSSRHPFRGQAFNCRSIDRVRSHITISAGSEKFPIFRDGSMNQSFFLLF
jgi:hypothetical protein